MAGRMRRSKKRVRYERGTAERRSVASLVIGCRRERKPKDAPRDDACATRRRRAARCVGVRRQRVLWRQRVHGEANPRYILYRVEFTVGKIRNKIRRMPHAPRKMSRDGAWTLTTPSSTSSVKARTVTKL